MVHIDGLHAAGQYVYLGIALSQTGIMYHARWQSDSGTGPQGPFKQGTIIRFGLDILVPSTTTPRAMQSIEVDPSNILQQYNILFQL